MNFQISNICILQLLMLLSSNALTSVPVEQSVIKGNGTTRTSKYYIRRKLNSNDGTNDAKPFDDKENISKLLRELNVEERVDQDSGRKKQGADRYKIYIKRKLRTSRRPVITTKVLKENTTKVFVQPYQTEEKRLPLSKARIDYKQLSTGEPELVYSKEKTVFSAPYAIRSGRRFGDPNNPEPILEQGGTSSETSAIVLEDTKERLFEVETQEARQTNKNIDATSMETEASYVYSTKTLRNKENDYLETPTNNTDNITISENTQVNGYNKNITELQHNDKDVNINEDVNEHSQELQNEQDNKNTKSIETKTKQEEDEEANLPNTEIYSSSQEPESSHEQDTILNDQSRFTENSETLASHSSYSGLSHTDYNESDIDHTSLSPKGLNALSDPTSNKNMEWTDLSSQQIVQENTYTLNENIGQEQTPSGFINQKVAQVSSADFHQEQPHTVSDRINDGETEWTDLSSTQILKKKAYTLSENFNPEQTQVFATHINEEHKYTPSGIILQEPYNLINQEVAEVSSDNIHQQLHTVANPINEGDLDWTDLSSSQISQENTHSRNEHINQASYIDQEQTHVFPGHIDQELHTPLEADQNPANVLNFKVIDYGIDIHKEPTPNKYLFTVNNLRKLVLRLGRRLKIENNIQISNFLKMIKLIMIVMKSQVTENDSEDTLWFRQLNPAVRYRLIKYVNNLVRHRWVQELMVQLHNNRYNLDVLKHRKWASHLVSWHNDINYDPNNNIEMEWTDLPSNQIFKENTYTLSENFNPEQTQVIATLQEQAPYDLSNQEVAEVSSVNIHQQLHTVSDPIKEGALEWTDLPSSQISHGNTYSLIEHINQGQTHFPSSHINQEQTHIFPDHIDQELHTPLETDQNPANVLNFKVIDYGVDIHEEPIPNKYLFTVKNLRKLVIRLERRLRIENNIQMSNFLKMIKLIMLVIKSQVTEDHSEDSLWFRQISPAVRYRLIMYVNNLVRRRWVQELLVQLHNNRYNLNVLNHRKWTSHLNSWHNEINYDLINNGQAVWMDLPSNQIFKENTNTLSENLNPEQTQVFATHISEEHKYTPSGNIIQEQAPYDIYNQEVAEVSSANIHQQLQTNELNLKVIDYGVDSSSNIHEEPLPNKHLFTVKKLRKLVIRLERHLKMENNVQMSNFLKMIKLIMIVMKSQVTEDDSEDSLWFRQLSSDVRYRLIKYVNNLVRRQWVQELMVELHKNRYNLNVLKHTKWASHLVSWRNEINYDLNNFLDKRIIHQKDIRPLKHIGILAITRPHRQLPNLYQLMTPVKMRQKFAKILSNVVTKSKAT